MGTSFFVRRRFHGLRLGLSVFVSVAVVVLPAVRANAQQAALIFDGINDVATIPAPPGWPSSTSNLTIEIWVRPTDVSGDEITGVFWGPQVSTGFGLKGNDNSAMVWTVSRSATASVYAQSGSLVAGRWDHFAGTWNGTTMRIYHNGSLIDDEDHPLPGSVGLYGGHVIGSRSTAGQPSFSGVVDEIRIWNTIRSEDDIRRWMARPLTGSEPDLLGYWRLDGGSGQIIVDSGSIGVDGVLGTSGSVEDQDPQWIAEGAPLAFFFDGFEEGDTLAWSVTVGDAFSW